MEEIVKPNSSLFQIFAAIVIFSLAGAAQRTPSGTPSKPSTGGNIPPPRVTNPTDSTLPPTIISGKVLLEGGNAPPGPVAIERVCNGVSRKEGYTDSKGQFQIQINQNTEFQDASESGSTAPGGDRQMNLRAGSDPRVQQLQGCEFRALLPGFQSTSVMFRLQGSAWQFDLGTIFIKHMDNVKGDTISASTARAPDDARRAYEKGLKDYREKKFSEAEKNLNKAVRIYPEFASAWSLLGDIHQQQEQFEQATKDYSQAVSADSKYVNPVFGLALIAAQQKRWPDTQQLTDQVIKLNAYAFPSAYFYNAVANYTLGKLDAAEDSARKFKPLDAEHRHPDICLLLSNIRVRKQDYAGAAQELRDYLKIAPDASNVEEIKAKAQRFEEMSVAKKQ